MILLVSLNPIDEVSGALKPTVVER